MILFKQAYSIVPTQKSCSISRKSIRIMEGGWPYSQGDICSSPRHVLTLGKLHCLSEPFSFTYLCYNSIVQRCLRLRQPSITLCKLCDTRKDAHFLFPCLWVWNGRKSNKGKNQILEQNWPAGQVFTLKYKRKIKIFIHIGWKIFYFNNDKKYKSSSEDKDIKDK